MKQTNRMIRIAAICFTIMSAVAIQAAESLSVLLQKGIYAEETEGNLDAAIKIYEGIVKEREANRSLVAQAQYRLGVCELKRGKRNEAVVAFRKLIDQFSDAAELVAKSRERLVELGQPAGATTVRQVWSGPEAAGDSISRNGRHLAFIDWNSGNVAVRDLKTGQSRRVTNQGTLDSPNGVLTGFAETCAISPDGEQIAFSWYENMPKGSYSYGLKLVRLETSTIRTLVPQKTNFWISPQDWSPDGTKIAVFTAKELGPGAKDGIAMIDVSDGSIRDLTSLPAYGKTLRFSPDGRYLAYNLQLSRSVETKNDICVADVQSGIQKLVLKHIGQENFLGWTPARSEIVFSSDRRGSTDLWSAQIENGQAVEPYKLLTADIGADTKPVGISGDGAFYYVKQSRDTRDFMVASVDFASGKVISPPKEAGKKFGAFNLKSSLSPDGRYLAFGRLGICDLKTGELRDFALSTNLSLASGVPRAIWSQDGRYYVTRGWTRLSPTDLRHTLLVFDRTKDKMKVIEVAEPKSAMKFSGMEFKDGSLCYFRNVGLQDSQTGQWDRKYWTVCYNLVTGEKRQTEMSNISDTGWVPDFTLSSDEKHLFFLRKIGTSPQGQSFVGICRERSTGKEVEFHRSTNQFVILGQPSKERPVLIAFADDPGHLRPVHTIKGIEITERSGKERFAFEVPKEVSFGIWGPFVTGSHVLFTRQAGGTESVPELWTLSCENGEIKKTDLDIRGMGLVGCHPDGQQIFLNKHDTSQNEVWVMENFLPPAASAK